MNFLHTFDRNVNFLIVKNSIESLQNSKDGSDVRLRNPSCN